MNTIKEMYEYPSLILCSIDKIPLTKLNIEGEKSIYNLTLTEKMNECNELKFSASFDNDKIGYDDCELLILFEGKYYIIKDINVNDTDSRLIDVICKEKCVELKGILCSIINVIGVSPLTMFNAIITSVKNPITDYIWKGTDVPSNKFRALQKDNECSVFENLLDMAKVFGGWLEFTSEANGKTGVYLRKNAINNGKFITKGRDLKQLNITYNSDEICTRMFGFGGTVELTGEPLNFMAVNPTGKSYVEDYTYYLAKGLTIAQIATMPQCLQETSFTDEYMVDATALMTETKEELAKVCVPKLSGTIDVIDVSVFEGSVQTKPQIGETILTIDEDINFNISSQIETIERLYDNAIEIKLGITNVIKYDVLLKDLTHSSDVVKEITDKNNDTGTIYVPEDKIEDGSHINLTYKLNDHSTKITENANEISLVAEETSGNSAQLVVHAGQIASTVTRVGVAESKITQNADQIQSTVTRLGVAESTITQQANQIALKVDEDDFGSLIEQNARNVKVAWNDISNLATLDDTKGLILGNESSGTYSKIGYDGRMEFMMNGSTLPYHCLMDGGSKTITCTDSAYTTSYVNLSSKFDGISDSQIKVICSVKKVYDTNIDDHNNVCFWFGCYASVSGGQIIFESMSKWRRVFYDSTDSWVEDINGDYNGMIDISWIAIA